MPHRTARTPHLRLCGQFTGQPRVFSPLLSLFHPSPRTVLSPGQNCFFSLKKKETKVSQKTRKQQKWCLVRCGEGHQTCTGLTKGLPYSSSRTGDEWSLESTLTEETRPKWFQQGHGSREQWKLFLSNCSHYHLTRTHFDLWNKKMLPDDMEKWSCSITWKYWPIIERKLKNVAQLQGTWNVSVTRTYDLVHTSNLFVNMEMLSQMFFIFCKLSTIYWEERSGH